MVYFQQDGQEWVVSPSQLETFDESKDGCQRKFAWRYIAGHRTEPTGSAALGSSVHALLEEYLQHGTLPDQNTREGEIATAGLHHLPNPSAEIIVEDDFRFRSPGGFLYQGRVDFQYLSDNGAELHDDYGEIIGGVTGPVWIVGDHKTTGDFRWRKTPKILEDDTQAIIYAANSLLESGHDGVILRWIYYRTRGAAASRVSDLYLPVSAVERRFQRIDEVTAKVHRVLATVTDPLELPANYDACAKFGGCPYQHLCQPSIGKQLGSYMSNLPVPPVPGLPVPGLPAAPQSAAQIPPDTAALLAQLQAANTAAAAVPPPAPQPDMLAALRQLQGAQTPAPVAPPIPPAPVAAPLPLAPPPVAAPMTPPAPAAPSFPAVPLTPPVAPPPVVPVAPIPPQLAAGTWADPAATGKYEEFVYPCHCGAQIKGSQLPGLAAFPDGNKSCPNCNRPIPGSAAVAAGIVQTVNSPEAVQQTNVAAPSAPVAGPPPNPETPKPSGRGRPAGSKNKVKAEETESETNEPVRVVWGKETFVASQYGSRVEIGPFERSDMPNDGETREACRIRLQSELTTWAEQERARKVQSFVASMPK